MDFWKFTYTDSNGETHTEVLSTSWIEDTPETILGYRDYFEKTHTVIDEQRIYDHTN